MKASLLKTLYFAVCIVLLLCCSVGCGKGDESALTSPETVVTKPTQAISYSQFDKADFFYLKNLNVPKGWYFENTDNGFITIEQKTGTQILFSIDMYNPQINSFDLETAKASLTTASTEFIAFQKPSGNEILCKYFEVKNGKKFLLYEYTTFNFTYTYTILLVTEEKLDSEYYPVFEAVCKSLEFPANATTIPKGYNGLYAKNLSLLTLYPRDWKTSIGSDYYTCSYSSSSITVTTSKPIENFNSMDKTTYTSIMQKSVQNFSTASFTNQNSLIKAEGYYTKDNVRYIILNTIINLEAYSINIVYVAPENELNAYLNVYTTMTEHIYVQKGGTQK